MISKAKTKLIKSLDSKKERDEKRLFVAEGNKCISELLKTYECEFMLATDEWMQANAKKAAFKGIDITEVSGEELKKASLLKNPKDTIAVFRQKTYTVNRYSLLDNIVLLLDGIQDPGNLGTIVRIADWFGIEEVMCSPQSADIYNPKTVQATMGSMAGVHVSYGDLAEFIRQNNDTMPVYGTFLNGDNIYAERLSGNGVIIIGNEGNGISPELERLVTKRLTIPQYCTDGKNIAAESLNAATATAIVCSEFRRRLM